MHDNFENLQKRCKQYKLKKRVTFDLDLIEKVSFSEVVERRKRATLFADQFKVGFYGNSAVEAMQFGIPVVNWISPLAFKQGPKILEKCPIVTTDKKVEDFARLFERVLTSDMQELSNKTKKWCDEFHSYQAVAKQMDKIYNGM